MQLAPLSSLRGSAKGDSSLKGIDDVEVQANVTRCRSRSDTRMQRMVVDTDRVTRLKRQYVIVYGAH